MATIKDVAQKSGFSIATVSRVINRRGYLREATIAAVKAAMLELDYLPNDLARSLHKQHSNILGVIVPSLAHPFFGEITSLIEYFAY
jgi:LacI family sucrose operon transcriptional repressor